MHTTASVIRHRITHMELDRCINFHVASSKYLEIRGPHRARALHVHMHYNTPNVHHRIALVELHRCTKFRVALSKFPEYRGAYARA